MSRVDAAEAATSMANAKEEKEEWDEEAEEGEKKKGEEESKEVKMDLLAPVEIREPKKGLRDSVRIVSYRRTGDFSQ